MGNIFNFGNKKVAATTKERKCKTMDNGTKIYWPEGFRLTASREQAFEEISIQFAKSFNKRVTAIFLNQDGDDPNFLRGINFSFQEK